MSWKEELEYQRAIAKKVEAGYVEGLSEHDLLTYHYSRASYSPHRGAAKYDCEKMARFMWDVDPEWMKLHGPKPWQQYSQLHLRALDRQRSLKEAREAAKAEARLTPAEAMRKSRAKYKDDPKHRYSTLLTRYIREGRIKPLAQLYDNCPEGVTINWHEHERALRVLGRVEEADEYKAKIAQRDAEWRAAFAKLGVGR